MNRAAGIATALLGYSPTDPGEAVATSHGSPTAEELEKMPDASGGQLQLVLTAPGERWRFTRPLLRSRHVATIRRKLEIVRSHFPELDEVCVRVGLARSRHVLGKGSLDPDDPGIWVRPRLADLFTITHEMMHLLQARELVPAGERACDLYALARSPLLVDSAPSYLDVPGELHDTREIPGWTRRLLSDTARRAIAERSAGRRQYLRYFERELATAYRQRREDVVAPESGIALQLGLRTNPI